MAAQASRAERLAVTDDVMLNDGERAKLIRKCVQFIKISAPFRRKKVKAGC